ncbi:MAG: DUF2235 domain-containing protein [Alphaproteobacteria bacterium]|nr:DUF2235 domain-containing protein [Alphaproteobacteria bacterium]
MKRIVIACDGTWQTLETPEATNVRKICESVKPVGDGVQQLVYYAQGIGTRSTFDRLTGGAFGHGINIEISDAYTFLCANYQPGDEIYLFGFSRGAYTVRSLAGLIYSCGILRREELSWLPNAYALYRRLDTPDREALAIRLQKRMGHGQTTEDPEKSAIRITFLGVWDTVGALGIPDLSSVLKLDRKSQDKHRFHNTYLSPIVDCARHAVGIDERRKVFRHTEMNPLPGFGVRKGQIRQVWFPGDHGCIGGGGDGRAEGDPQKIDKAFHSDAALLWMMDEAESTTGIEFRRDLFDLSPDPLAPFGAEAGGFDRRLSDPVAGPQPDNPGKDRRPFCGLEDIHASAITRWREDPSYRPGNLKAAHGAALSR